MKPLVAALTGSFAIAACAVLSQVIPYQRSWKQDPTVCD